MKLGELQEYCKSFKCVTEEFPFDATTLVFKVCGKMFVLTDFEKFESFSVKCDPDDAQAYRQMYEAVTPGYYLNKRLWNTVKMDGSIPDEILKSWIADSYNLVVAGLTKKARAEAGL